MIITLKCNECENFNCEICPIGSWIDPDSLKGCTRNVEEDICIQFFHLQQEISPFLKINPTPQKSEAYYREAARLQNKIYSTEVLQKIGKSGKIIK